MRVEDEVVDRAGAGELDLEAHDACVEEARLLRGRRAREVARLGCEGIEPQGAPAAGSASPATW